MGIKIEIHTIDDWEALYADGRLEQEGHSESLENYLYRWFRNNPNRSLTIDSITFHQHNRDAITDYVGRTGSFPKALGLFREIEIEAKKAVLRKMEEALDEKKTEIEALRAEIEKMKST